MASTSFSSSAMISSGLNCTMYDVFLSFRGEDTRNSFTDHLYEALMQAGFSTFRDNDAIGRGEDLKPQINKAIKASKASIIVLSKNYANSSWCLDELSLILEQRRNFNHFVLPVFYHVNPSDVRNHRQSFGMEGDDGAKRSAKWTEHNVNQWKAALTQVANLTGMVLNGPETMFIAEIVSTIGCKLDLTLDSTPTHLTGMDTRAKGINSWLKNEQSNDDVLAICGMRGSGKTTLAEYIYESNKEKFKCCSFLLEIGKHCEQPHGLLELQKKLLMDISGGVNKRISTVSEGTSKIEKALQGKKVLIVLDDVDKPKQLVALLGTKQLNRESKIIITTTDLKTQSWFESTSRRCQMYKIELMNDHESLELLSWHAFGSKIPMEGFKDLTLEVAQYCAGNPLALEVLGSSLSVRAEDAQKRNSIIENWSGTLNLLKRDVDSGIQGILRRSFDSLPFDTHRELFLHIACFFVGKDEDYVVKILEPDCHATAGIRTLINRCLLTISPSNKLMMHQLLQEMGRKIIRQESLNNPAKRSRVWCNNESYDVLTKGEGSETIEGLALDMRKLEQGMRSKSSTLKTDWLAKMDRLKFLQLKYVKLTGSYKNFPELRWLCWHGLHSKKLPSNLFMGSLVVIEMSHGNLEKFEPPMVLKSLKILNLKGSHKLSSIHNLSRLPNLETLILWNCSSLTDVCETIGGLESLALLDLTGCKNLGKNSLKKHTTLLKGLKASCFGGGNPQQPLFSLPHSLKFLFLNECSLEYNNHFRVVFSGQSFPYVNLGNNLFNFVPNNIDLKALRVLDLTCCPRLTSLLYLPSTLEELYTYCCVSLEKITFQSARFRLKEFGYGGCLNLFEIQGLFRMVSIAKIDETDLGHMKWLKAYQNCEVDLIGDEITKGRSWHIQMLYEYGIRSTFLPGFIKDDPNMVSDYMSSSPFLTFCVPSSPKRQRIQGLNVTFLYTPSGEDEDKWVLFAKISNTTKDLTWIYNPVVFCKPGVGEDAVWLSYWPIGNILDAGDEVDVSIIVGKELMVSGCCASLVYSTDGEVDKENWENIMEWEEVIGGDLSEFELSTGGYYLCRRDFFKSTEDGMTPDWFKILVGDTIQDTELKGWSKSRQSQQLKTSFTELKTFRGINITGYGKKVKFKVDIHSSGHIKVVKKAVSKIAGVRTISLDVKSKTLTVTGEGFDPVYMVGYARKLCHTEILTVGPAKEHAKIFQAIR